MLTKRKITCIHCYFIQNVDAADGEKVTFCVTKKIEYKPGVFGTFGDKDDAIAQLENKESRKQMVELVVQIP